MLLQRFAWMVLLGWVTAFFALACASQAEDLRVSGGGGQGDGSWDLDSWAIEQTNFKDWRLICSHGPGKSAPTCLMTTAAPFQDGKAILVIRGLEPENDAIRLSLMFPVTFDQDLSFGFAVGDIFFEQRLDAGSVLDRSFFESGREQLFLTMRRESQAVLTGNYAELGPISLSFSLAGFSAASDAWNDRLEGKVRLTQPYKDDGVFGPLTRVEDVTDFIRCRYSISKDFRESCKRLLALPELTSHEQAAALAVALQVNELLDTLEFLEAEDSLTAQERDEYLAQLEQLISAGINLDPRNPSLHSHMSSLLLAEDEALPLGLKTGFWYGIFDPDPATHLAMYRFAAIDAAIRRWIMDENNPGYPVDRFWLELKVICGDAIRALESGSLTWDLLVQRHPAAGFAALSGETEASCRDLVAESPEGAAPGAVDTTASPEVQPSAEPTAPAPESGPPTDLPAIPSHGKMIQLLGDVSDFISTRNLVSTDKPLVDAAFSLASANMGNNPEELATAWAAMIKVIDERPSLISYLEITGSSPRMPDLGQLVAAITKDAAILRAHFAQNLTHIRASKWNALLEEAEPSQLAAMSEDALLDLQARLTEALEKQGLKGP